MSNKRQYTGSCLCKKVQFLITGKIEDIIYCHCSLCRKAQGSAFATNGNVKASDFKFIAGEGLLTGFEASQGKIKYFCQHCGSPIISKNVVNPDVVRVRLGVLDSDILEKPQAHIFVSSKAAWDEISDELPRHDGYPPLV